MADGGDWQAREVRLAPYTGIRSNLLYAKLEEFLCEGDAIEVCLVFVGGTNGPSLTRVCFESKLGDILRSPRLFLGEEESFVPPWGCLMDASAGLVWHAWSALLLPWVSLFHL